nr:retrovirus-related Pol polyprotein from transposon TNT 1-94 [Tanacetum cinerariifolium]
QKSGIQCYNCKEYGHIARECQKPKRANDAAYHREKMLLCKQEEAGIQLNAEQANWRDDNYDVFAIDCQHSEQSESVHNTYLTEQDAQTMLIDSEDTSYDSEQIDQNDEDVDLAKESELLASLISKLKCE